MAGSRMRWDRRDARAEACASAAGEADLTLLLSAALKPASLCSSFRLNVLLHGLAVMSDGLPSALSTWSVDAILFVQQLSPHPWLDDAVVSLTLLGDPKLVFLYLAPLIYWCAPSDLRRSLGIELLLGLMMSDVLNALLKWPFQGDRPYWFDERVKEFSVTCESGFGMPSGHMMVSSCVVFLLLARVPARRRAAAVAIAAVFLFLLALSRMYVGAHFPGQVTAGAACGLSLGFVIHHWRLESQLSLHFAELQRKASSPRAFLLHACALGAAASAVILGIAVVEFAVLSLFIDPLISLQLAHDGCEATRVAAAAALRAGPADAAAAAAAVEEQARFQRDRGPFMGICRDAGVALGGALALALMQLYALAGTPPSPPRATQRLGGSIDADEAETVLLQSNGHRGASTSKSTAAPAASTSWLAVVLRGVFGLLEAYVFQLLLLWLLDSSVAAALSVPFPQGAVYAKNFLLFGGIALNYLAIVPALWKRIAAVADNARSMRTPSLQR